MLCAAIFLSGLFVGKLNSQTTVIPLNLSGCVVNVGSGYLGTAMRPPNGYWWWLESFSTWTCSVTVPSAGQYTLAGTGSTPIAGQALSLTDGNGVSLGSLPIVNTGSTNIYGPVTTAIQLPAGTSTIVLQPTSGDLQISDALTLTPSGPPPPFVWIMPGLGTATFPMQIPPACGPNDGTCSIEIQVCDTSVNPPNCITSSQGTITLLKNVTLPTPQQQSIPLVVVTNP